MPRSIDLCLFTDVSGRSIGLIFTGKRSIARLLKTGEGGCPETWVNEYRSTLRNIPEERRTRTHSGGHLGFKHVHHLNNIRSSTTVVRIQYLTPQSRVVLEKLTGPQLVNKFPMFYTSRKFITAFTSARHLSLS